MATWGGWWDGGQVRLTPEDIRQLRGEARQYASDAQDLRGMLRGENIDPRELDEIVNALRQLEDERVYQNVAGTGAPAGVRGRESQAVRVRLAPQGRRRTTSAIALSGSDEVPEEFRKLVEQYYRSLAQSPR